MNWGLEIAFHWPHNRLAIGWEYMSVDEDHDFRTLKIYMFFITFTLDF